MILFDNKQVGKSFYQMELLKAALAEGKTAIVASNNLPNMTRRMSMMFPGALFEVMGNWGLKIWLKKAKPE